VQNGGAIMVKCAGLLLAAGKSTRMGSLKALLPWEGTTLLQFQLTQLERSMIDQIIIVLGYESNKLLPYAKESSAHLVWNPDYEKGKTESIKAGVRAIENDVDCFIITSVDQPVNHFLLDALILQFRQAKANIIIPVYNEKRGHPILLSSNIRDEILQLNEETHGLKAILQNRNDEISELIVEDHSILFNFNNKKDYEEGILKGGTK
jgi:molybdenum cofactor cytidylyltransferase